MIRFGYLIEVHFKVIKKFLEEHNIKIYGENKLIDLSTNDLQNYFKSLYIIMLDNPLNTTLFMYIDKLFKFWIKRREYDEIDNKTAYHIYLNFLNLTNHYYEAYDICMKLLKNNKYHLLVYKQLTDFGYVCDGVFSFSEHLDYIRKYIDICEDEEDKNEMIDLLRYEENLWQ